MLLYIEGTKIRNKTHCTPNLKMQWEPWISNTVLSYLYRLLSATLNLLSICKSTMPSMYPVPLFVYLQCILTHDSYANQDSKRLNQYC